jgi:predicted RNA-binding protein YlqC (UPF0109 family)
MTTDYAGLVEYIVKNIVETPDAVVVDGNSRRHRSQTVEVRLDPADVGRVIGKGGKNIEAIRAVVKAAAIKDHTRVNVEVVTEDDFEHAGDALSGASGAVAETPGGQAPEDGHDPEGQDHEGHHPEGHGDAEDTGDAHTAGEGEEHAEGATVPEIVEG